MSTSILLLNATDQPLSFIPRRRALDLFWRGRVDPASGETVSIRGCSTVLWIPKVIRLRRYVQMPQMQARWTRKRVLQRDNYECIYCGIKVGDSRDGRVLTRRDFTIDHILPKSRGGPNTWANTACACAPCNHNKAARLPHEAGLKLRWEPKTPRTDYLVLDGRMPKAWKVYVATG